MPPPFAEEEREPPSQARFPALPPPSFTPPAEEAEPRPPPNRDEVAEAEFRVFLRDLLLDASDESPSNQLFANSPFPVTNLFSARPATTNTNNTSSSSYDDDTGPSFSNSNLESDRMITPADLYPITLNCRAAFDAAFHCQSVGGQFKAVYHHGSMRDCSPLWSHFWFCVKTNRRRMRDEERQGRVLEHYRVREMKYRTGPSSEDVWVQRETMLVGAFGGDLEAALAEEKRGKGEIDD